MGGETNVCYNALDRHVLDGHGDQVRRINDTVTPFQPPPSSPNVQPVIPPSPPFHGRAVSTRTVVRRKPC